MATCAWFAHQRKVIKAYIKAIISQPPAHNEWCTSSYSLPLYTLLSFLASAEREKERRGEGEERRGEEVRGQKDMSDKTKQKQHATPTLSVQSALHYTKKHLKKNRHRGREN